jgi:hypothetical protein
VRSVITTRRSAGGHRVTPAVARPDAPAECTDLAARVLWEGSGASDIGQSSDSSIARNHRQAAVSIASGLEHELRPGSLAGTSFGAR